MIQVRRALLSVSDKTGIVELGEALAAAGAELLSTGGTAKVLREAGLAVTDVSDVTGFPECLDGRVKTLHPNIHGGILADRSKPAHLETLETLGIGPIDLVAVNLYPFEWVAEKPGTDRATLIENIDIGGPSMIRAAAKNGDHVVVLCDPADYDEVIASLAEGVDPALAGRLAAKSFVHTAAYDAAIAAALNPGLTTGEALPEHLPLGLVESAPLRYGENPHQRGMLYRPAGIVPAGFAALEQFQGKALSYNNYLDMHAAYGLAAAFDDPVAVIVKHQNPCGVGFAASMTDAYRRALDADPVSAFGGVVALNRPLTAEAAELMAEIFLEVIVAPAVEDGVKDVLARKKNLRVVQADPSGPPLGVEIRPVMGGWLVQTPDGNEGDTERKVVTKRAPTGEEMRALERAWVMVRHVRSNAIVLADEDGILGLGCGQTNRVDAVAHAAARDAANRVETKVRVLASDAFFPFRDGLDAAAGAGATAVIQPGGSVRDEEVIAAADEHGIAMVFTGRRSFRH
jgi:phosphoribosylaminoimidazolecarboxamide formyltransferase/IMP cyclohydrolase